MFANICFFKKGVSSFKKDVTENSQFYKVDIFFVSYIIPIPCVKLTCIIFDGCTARAFVKLSQ